MCDPRLVFFNFRVHFVIPSNFGPITVLRTVRDHLASKADSKPAPQDLQKGAGNLKNWWGTIRKKGFSSSYEVSLFAACGKNVFHTDYKLSDLPYDKSNSLQVL